MIFQNLYINKIRFVSNFIAIFSLCISPIAISANESSNATFDLSNISEDEMSTSSKPEIKIADPFEGFNRGVFKFNKGFDKVVMMPAATAYKFAVPDWGKERIDSVLTNLYEPVSFANAIIQGDFKLAERNLARFLTNTVLGLGGLFDVASLNEKELSPAYTDFGLTLKSYGADTGPYLVLPILGPSSPRDAVGLVGDMAMNPYNYLADKEARIAKTAIESVNLRYEHIDTIQDIENTSLDEYATFRSIYAQKRK